MRLFVFSSLIASACLATAQNYNGPESVEYDPVGDRYLVSNTGSGQILARDQAGELSLFTAVSPSPYGLEILGDVLYACSGTGVKGFSLSTGLQLFNLSFGSGFSNGITTDGSHVYVTDFSGKRILKVDPVAASYEVLVANTTNTPNGIVYDAVRDRLWVAGWGTNALIKAYDRVTGEQLVSHATGLGSIDGITLDCNGKLLVASWSPARLSRFDPDALGAGVTVLNSGLSSPADIDYDHVHDRVCIPNSSANSVVLHAYDCSTGIPDVAADSWMIAPNPVGEVLQVMGDHVVGRTCFIRDLHGRIVLSEQVPPNGSLQVARLVPGTYLVEVEGHAPIRLVRQ